MTGTQWKKFISLTFEVSKWIDRCKGCLVRVQPWTRAWDDRFGRGLGARSHQQVDRHREGKRSRHSRWLRGAEFFLGVRHRAGQTSLWYAQDVTPASDR